MHENGTTGNSNEERRDRLEVQIRAKNEECKVARNELAGVENSLRNELHALKNRMIRKS